MNVIFLLGSNLGDRLHHLKIAKQALEKDVGKAIKSSKIYETASWGIEDQGPFLNQVIELESGLSPHPIMEKIKDIEYAMGRQRNKKWESRVIDIDILFYGEEVINQPDLVIPHPYLHLRRFTLVPLAEIEGSKIHPLLKKTCAELLVEVPDSLPVSEFSMPFATK